MGLVCPNCEANPTVPIYRRGPGRLRELVLLDVLVVTALLFALVGALHLVLATFGDPTFQSLWSQQPHSDRPEDQDRVLLFRNALLFFVWVPAATSALLGIAMGTTWSRARAMGPTAWHAVRTLVWSLALVEVICHLALVSLFSDVVTYQPRPILGLAVIPLPGLLWLLRRQRVREYFGVYRLVPVPKPPALEATPDAR